MKTTTFKTSNVQNAINFRNSLSTDNVYLCIGKANEQWTDENSIPQYSADDDAEILTRSSVNFLIKLQKADTMLGIRRNDWSFNTQYDSYSSDDSTLFSQDFFTINNNLVFKCLSNNSNGYSTAVPNSISTNNIILSDGYTWKFMYDLSDTYSDFITTDFFPVPNETTQKTSFQKLVESVAVNTENSPSHGHGYDAATELFGSNLIIFKEIVFADISVGTVAHRQLSIIVNPKDTNNQLLTGSLYDIDDTNTSVDLYSGNLLLLNNHRYISSENTTDETIKLVLNF